MKKGKLPKPSLQDQRFLAIPKKFKLFRPFFTLLPNAASVD
jgi:hypothetical protein